LRISDEYLVYAQQQNTSCEVWTALAAIFEARMPISINNLCREFFRTIAKEGADMEQHARTMRKLQMDLHARGEIISEGEFSNTLLTSLPESWSTFITKALNRLQVAQV
jgi:hypothetical protein